MAQRLYIVPVVLGGKGGAQRVPKYFGDGTVMAPGSPIVDYGHEPWMFVYADLSPSDDTLLTSEPDVIALPFNLDQNLTAGQVTNTKNKLEVINIPAGWVTTSLTWRQVVRVVLGIFTFRGRYEVIYAQANGSVAPSMFSGGITLDSTFSSLPQAMQDAMVATAQSFNISTAGLTAGTTIRTILKSLGDSFVNWSFFDGSI